MSTVLIQKSVLSGTIGGSTAVANSVLHGLLNTDQVNDITHGNHIKFSGVVYQKGSDITLDNSSAYVSGGTGASFGRITLQANKVYRLTGQIAAFYDNTTTGNAQNFRWFNVTSGTPLGTDGRNALGQVEQTTAIAYVNPTVQIRVHLQIGTEQQNFSYFVANRTNFTVETIN